MYTLYDICKMIAEIEEGLAYGEIDFTYDRLMSVMKPGHPADLLDEILSLIGWDVFKGETPEHDTIEQVYEQLKSFKATFKIKELKKPIDALEEYLYPSRMIEFPILIADYNESYIEYPVSRKELSKIKKAMDEGYDFEEAPGLKGFYNKLMKAAKKKIIEDVELTFDDIDYDDIEYCVDYPEEV